MSIEKLKFESTPMLNKYMILITNINVVNITKMLCRSLSNRLFTMDNIRTPDEETVSIIRTINIDGIADMISTRESVHEELLESMRREGNKIRIREWLKEIKSRNPKCGIISYIETPDGSDRVGRTRQISQMIHQPAISFGVDLDVPLDVDIVDDEKTIAKRRTMLEKMMYTRESKREARIVKNPRFTRSSHRKKYR